jgi:SAM-dependent methyltransferase
MDTMGFQVKLRCIDCHEPLLSFYLQDIPKVVKCGCGNNYSYGNGYLDTLIEDNVESIQTDYVPDMETFTDHSLFHLEGQHIYDVLEDNRRISPHLLKLLDIYAPKAANRAILDIGLGVITRRKIRYYFSDLMDYFDTYIGLDPSRSQLEKNDDGADLYNRLFVRGVGEKIPFQNNQFEVVLILSTLDHCIALVNVKNEIVRVLKPGGLLMISLNNNASWFKSLFPRKAQKMRKDGANKHNYFFSYDEIDSLIRNEFFILHKHDYRYLPFNFYTTNPIIGKPYFWCLSLIECFGRYFLRGKGGNFVIIARKGLI